MARPQVIGLYPLTLFLSAWLLFSIQPMIARALLPDLGGAPVVWNTCVVFFQLMLLSGYGYAHLLSRRMSVSRQRVCHLGLLALPLGLFSVATLLHGTPLVIWPGTREWLSPTGHPLAGMLGVLTLTVGLPALMLSASSPLLQRWYSLSGTPMAADAYVLYAASNAGSLLALISYPVVVERYLPVHQQWWLWCTVYLVFVGLTFACSATPRSADSVSGKRTEQGGPSRSATRLAPRQYLRWLALAALPCSLLIAVTTHITTDIAAVPLLWILPLLLYLLTFIIAFSRRRLVSHEKVLHYVPMAVIVWCITVVLNATQPASLLIGIHLATYFWVALACHGELYQTRPPLDRLTDFYLMISVGGLLGGFINTFIAPLLFEELFEYPLAMVLACMLTRSAPEHTPLPNARQATSVTMRLVRSGVNLLAPLLAGGLLYGTSWLLAKGGYSSDQAVTDLLSRWVRGVGYVLPLLVCLVWVHKAIPFALGIGSVLFASSLLSNLEADSLHRERTLFGIHRVQSEANGLFHVLMHGNTVHGRQRWLPQPSSTPGSYYHPSGPAGDVFSRFREQSPDARIAVIGLGSGSLAYYGRDQLRQHWTFYEIDPAVVRIATNPQYFTFMSEAFRDPARRDIIVGDARLKLREAPPKHFDLIALDAFSSDSIPVHLLTREAVELYLGKLADHGLLLFHVSNRHLDLRPLLASLARHVDEGLVCLGRDDLSAIDSPEMLAEGKLASQWVVLARSREDVEFLPGTWRVTAVDPQVTPWSDDYVDIFGVLKDSFWLP